MIGELAILNVGVGDTKLSFDPSKPAEVERAKGVVMDMIRRGFVLLIEVGDFERAGGQCECEGECGHDHGGRCEARHGEPHPVTGSKVILTTAHRNHMPEDCRDEAIFAACQRCHLSHDREHHKREAAITRARKAEAAQDRRIMQAECMAFAIECATGQRWPRMPRAGREAG